MKKMISILTMILFLLFLVVGCAKKKEDDNTGMILLLLAIMKSQQDAQASQTVQRIKPSSYSSNRGTCEWITSSGSAACTYNYIESACAGLPDTSLGGTVWWYNDATSNTCNKLGYVNCNPLTETTATICRKSSIKESHTEVETKSLLLNGILNFLKESISK